LRLAFALAVLASQPLLARAADAPATRPSIDISGATFKPLPLAVPEIRGTGDKAVLKEIDEALVSDLQASGIFEVLDRKGFLATGTEGMRTEDINFKHWLDVGADGLVKVAVSVSAGEISSEARLYTVGGAHEELKINPSVPGENPRQLAHRIANQLFRFYTKEPGVFESKMAYVKKTGINKDVCYADWDGHHERCFTQGGLNLLPAWSPDGSKIAFTSYRAGNPDIFVYDLGTKAITGLVKKGALATGAAFSANGARVAYSLSEGESSHLWVINADGSGDTRLTSGYGIDTSPAWSPDGARLAFVSNRAGSPQLYTMAASAGAEPTRITFQGTYNQTPDWSPRGDLLAFTGRDERAVFDLFTFAFDGNKVTRLTQGAGSNLEPTFSPNGRLIGFTSTRGGGSDLYVMGLDGSNVHQLTHSGNVYTPVWGPLPKQP
jgi:TolB protein